MVATPAFAAGERTLPRDAIPVASSANAPPPVDGGLKCLELLIALHGGAFDAGRAPGASDLLRIAKAEGFKARLTRSSVGRLDALALPAIGRRARAGSWRPSPARCRTSRCTRRAPW